MNYERVKELMAEADAERLSYGEIAEIEAAFAEVPDDRLRDLRDNASVVDMLIELEDSLQFDAVLAKNNLARAVRDDRENRSVLNELFQLEEIEKFIGTANQPTVREIIEDTTGNI